jgi:hypothetical protein
MSETKNNAATVVGAIAEQNLKDDDASNSKPNFIVKFIQVLFSSIVVGIFEKPPFALETMIPLSIFKNKYFKTFSISLIYLALILSLITVFKPKNNRAMFYSYTICFWITVLILSFWIISPYDENSVEYMLRDKVIKTVKDDEDEIKPSAPPLQDNPADTLKPSAPPLQDNPADTLKPSAPPLPIKPSAPPLPQQDIIADVNEDQLETEKLLTGP